jgi:hypothetical protein
MRRTASETGSLPTTTFSGFCGMRGIPHEVYRARDLKLKRERHFRKRACKFTKWGTNLKKAMQICKSPFRLGNARASLEKAVQVWKPPRKFANRRANLQNGHANLQIAMPTCKTLRKSGNRDAILQNAM